MLAIKSGIAEQVLLIYQRNRSTIDIDFVIAKRLEVLFVFLVIFKIMVFGVVNVKIIYLTVTKMSETLEIHSRIVRLITMK